MKPPYVVTRRNEMTAAVTDKAISKGACIFQHSWDTCRFSFGDKGATMIEYDYRIKGHTLDNWFSFWLDPHNGKQRFVREAEVDTLEKLKWKNYPDH